MRDLEAEQRFPQPMYRPEARERCPSCGALPPLRYQTIVRNPFADQYAKVVTCASHYCRARAAEFARFE